MVASYTKTKTITNRLINVRTKAYITASRTTPTAALEVILNIIMTIELLANKTKKVRVLQSWL